MFKELDIVNLTIDIDDHNLKKGRHGTIVHCYNNQQAFEVEFVDDDGDTLALLTLEKSQIELEQESLKSHVVEIINTLPVDDLADIRDNAEVLQFLHNHARFNIINSTEITQLLKLKQDRDELITKLLDQINCKNIQS